MRGDRDLDARPGAQGSAAAGLNQSSFSVREAEPSARVFAIIALSAIARFLLASTVGLGVDESYAVTIAREFSLSYYDHPPLHFWLAGAVAKLVNTEAPEAVRFPFVLCFAGTTWFTWRIAQRFWGDLAGILAALLLNVSAVFSLSTGGWVLPDGPLMLLTTAAADRISMILFDEKPGARMLDWCLAGVYAGLAMLSKYHGVFVLAGTAGFLATSARHRRWLATPGPWLGTLIALALFTPVLIWNSEHHWASFAFQGARAEGASGIHVDTMLTNIGGQMAWVLPWIFIPLVASAWRALRAGPSDDKRWFLLSLAAGPIVAFTLISLRGDVGLPHWQAPGWLFVFPLLGAAAAERVAAGSLGTKRWLRWSLFGYIGLITVLTSHASTGWISKFAPEALKNDPSGDMVTWSSLRPTLTGLGYFPGNNFVAATSWIQAGKAGIGVGPDVPVLCLCNDPHHFYYAENDSSFLGRDALLVKKRRDDDDVLTRYAPYFERIDPIAAVPIYRERQFIMTIDVYRGKNFKALYPTAQPR
jgi:4-amino-4-deoxy-L-arabinose transferase-like glycosyltransferase